MRKKTAWAWRIGAAGAAALAAAPFGVEALRRRVDRKRFPPKGIFAEVDGHKMHVASEGAGQKTLVFLPGLGTPSPALDFSPVISRLRAQVRCVVPEPFGYGYSDNAYAPRTAANIIGEIRAGLLSAGFRPPYSLFVHSIAGIYALYWAARYPGEIEAVFGSDTSVPAQCELPEMQTRGLYRYPALMHLLNRSGLARLRTLKRKTRLAIRRQYSGNSLLTRTHLALAGSNALTFCVADELCHVVENCSVARHMRFPRDCVLRLFVAQDTVNQYPAGSNLDWLGEHQKQALSVDNGKALLLPGTHYLHWQQADTMAKEIRSVLLAPEPVSPNRRIIAVRSRKA